MKQQKKWSFSTFILSGLMILLFLGVLYGAFRDFTLSSKERLEIAQLAEKNNQLRKAERYYLMGISDSDSFISMQSAYRLSRLYRTGGEQFPIDGRRAELFLEQAALAGMPEAQYELALMYDVGDKIPEKREKALKWMNLSAQQGYANALYALGVWVERGYLGKPDMKKVIGLYERSAVQNHPQAITSLIALYAGGFQGVQPDKEKATYWMNKLAEFKK